MKNNLVYYKQLFFNLKRSKSKGEKTPHKLILLLAVIDRIEQLIDMGTAGCRMIDRNLIDLSPKLERMYYDNWNRYVDSKIFSPNYYASFFQMNSEPFWRLLPKKDAPKEGLESIKNLIKCYEGAEIDFELMQFLVDAESREILRLYILKLLDINKESELVFDNNKVDKAQQCVSLIACESESVSYYSVSSDSFAIFMKRIGLSDRSIKKYVEQVPNNNEVKNYIYELTKQNSLFNITDISIAEKLRELIKGEEFNKRGNNMYSCGISNYIKFLKDIKQN